MSHDDPNDPNNKNNENLFQFPVEDVSAGEQFKPSLTPTAEGTEYANRNQALGIGGIEGYKTGSSHPTSQNVSTSEVKGVDGYNADYGAPSSNFQANANEFLKGFESYSQEKNTDVSKDSQSQGNVESTPTQNENSTNVFDKHKTTAPPSNEQNPDHSKDDR